MPALFNTVPSTSAQLTQFQKETQAFSCTEQIEVASSSKTSTCGLLDGYEPAGLTATKKAQKRYTHNPYSFLKAKTVFSENQEPPTKNIEPQSKPEGSIDNRIIPRQTAKEAFIVPNANYVVTGIELIQENSELPYYRLHLHSKENPSIKGARYYPWHNGCLTDASGARPLGERSPLRKDGVLPNLLRHFGFDAIFSQSSNCESTQLPRFF